MMELLKLVALLVICLCSEGLDAVRMRSGEAEYLEAAVGFLSVDDEKTVDVRELLFLPEISKRWIQKRASTIMERPGNSVEEHACGSITTLPDELRRPQNMYPKGLDVFYQKYTHAYGIPIVASSKVSDTGLKRACYLLRFMLADRPDVRESFYKMFGRLALMAPDEMTTAIPEHSHMDPTYWDGRARGLGATRSKPVSTGGEENVLCLKKDRYPREAIVLHELVHAVHLIGAQYAIPGFNARLKALYDSAKAKGLWANTYAMTNHIEYWAEVVQSYFNDNDIGRPANGVHNDIYNRVKLRDYDPEVYALIEEIWPCKNTLLNRCLTSRELEQAQVLKMNCNGTNNNYFSYDTSCTDSHFQCPDWALGGQCTSNPGYMKGSCKRSCRQCTTTYRGQANKGSQSSVAPLMTCADTGAVCRASSCTSNIDYSTEKCRQTCIGCQYYIDLLSGVSVCKDSNANCASWASTGECTANPAYMLSSCKKSCNVC